MQSTVVRPRFVEPFDRTLARNAIIAVVVATVFALVQHRLWLIGPVALLALWFSLGGHYVEVIFLNGVRPRIPAVRTIQSLVRILIWICGGILLYWGMAVTARVLPVRAPSLVFWWSGGLILTAVELVAHAFLALRGLPNFYSGKG